MSSLVNARQLVTLPTRPTLLAQSEHTSLSPFLLCSLIGRRVEVHQHTLRSRTSVLALLTHSNWALRKFQHRHCTLLHMRRQSRPYKSTGGRSVLRFFLSSSVWLRCSMRGASTSRFPDYSHPVRSCIRGCRCTRKQWSTGADLVAAARPGSLELMGRGARCRTTLPAIPTLPIIRFTVQVWTTERRYLPEAASRLRCGRGKPIPPSLRPSSSENGRLCNCRRSTRRRWTIPSTSWWQVSWWSAVSSKRTPSTEFDCRSNWRSADVASFSGTTLRAVRKWCCTWTNWSSSITCQLVTDRSLPGKRKQTAATVKNDRKSHDSNSSIFVDDDGSCTTRHVLVPPTTSDSNQVMPAECLMLRCSASEECTETVFECIFQVSHRDCKLVGVFVVVKSRGLSYNLSLHRRAINASDFFKTFAEEDWVSMTPFLLCRGGREAQSCCRLPAEPAFCPESFLPSDQTNALVKGLVIPLIFWFCRHRSFVNNWIHPSSACSFQIELWRECVIRTRPFLSDLQRLAFSEEPFPV